MANLLKLSNAVKEMRILFSPINPSSAGVREFINKTYGDIRDINPGVKFMIREGKSATPRIYARYGFGKESFTAVDNASVSEILEKIRKLGSA